MRQTNEYATVGELARLFTVKNYQIREVVDEFAEPVPRAGLYRMVPRTRVPEVAAGLQARGWLEQRKATEVGREQQMDHSVSLAAAGQQHRSIGRLQALVVEHIGAGMENGQQAGRANPTDCDSPAV